MGQQYGLTIQRAPTSQRKPRHLISRSP